MEHIPNFTVEYRKVPIDTNYLIPAVLWYLFSYFGAFHDQISNRFKIRHHFDFQYILIPMANEVGIALNAEQRKKVYEDRNELMDKVFYKYADSTEPKISKHNIILALTNWALFWICIESITVLMIFLILFLFLTLNGISLILALLIIILSALGVVFYKRAIRIINTEIRLIFNIESETEQVSESIKKVYQDAL